MVKESNRDGNIKKKRKSGHSGDGDTDIDIYKKSIEFEEKEALSRPSDVDAQLYFQTCQEIRELLAEIADLKSKSNSSEAKAKIQEKTTEICLRIVLLRKLNRMEKVRQVQPKELLAQEKQKVDSINLQYQNLLYEANYLIFEYRKCFQFKSKDEAIDLVPVEEFLREAPKDLSEKFINFDEKDETMKHELRLARLTWELQQRKNLAETCKQLEEEKKRLVEEIEERKCRLEKLGPLLNHVMEATRPVQEHLDLNIDKIQAEHKLASLLPNPLYLFYANADAYKQVNDKTMDVIIVGDQEEAIQWKALQESAIDEDEDDEEEKEDEVQESEEILEKKRRHRKSIQIDPVEEKKKKLLQIHPLSVNATIKTKDLKITIKIFYCTKLQIITVKSDVEIPDSITANSAREVLSSESILGELVEGDLGIDSPNPCTPYQLKKFNISSFYSLLTELGFAYNWAQKICGLDFLSKKLPFSKDSYQISQDNVETVMKTLKKRLQNRFALAKQLEDLEKNHVACSPPNVTPKQSISNITKFTSSTYQRFCQSKFTEHFLDIDLITPNDLFYLIRIERGEAQTEAFIVIKNDYPLTAPIFAISLNYNGTLKHSRNCDNIRDMERTVNIEWDKGASGANWLLGAQITSLCICMDIYLETEDPKVFPQNTMYIKSCCARNRRKPFKFRNIGVGVFTQ